MSRMRSTVRRLMFLDKNHNAYKVWCRVPALCQILSAVPALYSRYCTLYTVQSTLHRVNIYSKQGRKTNKKDIVIHRHGTASERFPRASNDSLSDPLHPPGGRNVGPSVTG